MKQKKLYIRKNLPPGDGRSKNYFTQKKESGISVWEAIEKEANGYVLGGADRDKIYNEIKLCAENSKDDLSCFLKMQDKDLDDHLKLLRILQCEDWGDHSNCVARPLEHNPTHLYFLVEGDEVGERGSDGEPLIKNIQFKNYLVLETDGLFRCADKREIEVIRFWSKHAGYPIEDPPF